MKGTVSKWDAEKYFGFITPDDPDFSDAFLHQRQLPPGVRGSVGMRVEYDIGPPNDHSKQSKAGSAINVKCE
jgi:cold shock CspA family protein